MHTSTVFTWTTLDIENADIALSDGDMRGANEVFDAFISLKPETDDTIRLYTSTGGVKHALHLGTDATTTANSTANYDVADFSRGGGGGEFDLSDLNEDSAKSAYVMNELFATGEEVVVTLSGGYKKK